MIGLMRWSLSLAFLLSVAAAPPPVPAPSPEPGPNYYLCMVNRQGPGSGSITYLLSVPVDGSAPYHRVTWVIVRQPGGLSLQVESSGETPAPGGHMDDRAWYFSRFSIDHPVRGEARLEIRRRSDRYYQGEFAFAGDYQRGFRYTNPFHQDFETQGRWGDLRAWLAGSANGVTFALVQRDGTVIAQQRLDAAMIEAGAAAIEQTRAEAEAMARDYRNRCDVPEPVVIT